MRRQAISLRHALVAVAACGLGCGWSDAPLPIDREVFIEAYVELRLAALGADDFEIDPRDREDILARLGVDQEALLYFAEVHGPDPEFMNEVWSEVERRLEERRPGSEA